MTPGSPLPINVVDIVLRVPLLVYKQGKERELQTWEISHKVSIEMIDELDPLTISLRNPDGSMLNFAFALDQMEGNVLKYYPLAVAAGHILMKSLPGMGFKMALVSLGGKPIQKVFFVGEMKA